METLVIGIAGGTGSGKTTLTRKISEIFGKDVSVIYHDNYYKAHDEMPFEERKQLNYDHPDAFDTDLMVKHIDMLCQGQTVECPMYDYTQHTRAKETVIIKPAKILLVEGILIFQSKELTDRMNIKIYVDTDADVRILRRIVRDVKKRGRDLDSVITQYLTTVKPMHEQFVEPSKKRADIIIPEGGENRVAIAMLTEHIKGYMGR